MLCLHAVSSLLFGSFSAHPMAGSGDRLEVKAQREVTWHFSVWATAQDHVQRREKEFLFVMKDMESEHSPRTPRTLL